MDKYLHYVHTHVMRYSPPKSNVIIFHIKATILGYLFGKNLQETSEPRANFMGLQSNNKGSTTP